MPPLVLNTRTAHIDIYPSTSGARARQPVTLNLVPGFQSDTRVCLFSLRINRSSNLPPLGNPRCTLADIFVVFQKSIVPISVSTDRRRQRAIDKSSVYASRHRTWKFSVRREWWGGVGEGPHLFWLQGNILLRSGRVMGNGLCFFQLQYQYS
jgi:hypothetical protein